MRHVRMQSARHLLRPIFTLSIILSIYGALSNTAIAADGSSGCGPGWYVAKKNSLLSSALRATTNGFLYPTTTIGMTMGTSNCSKHKLVRNEKRSLHFVTNNYFELQTETAMGQGEFLDSFANTLGCAKSSLPQFKQSLKSNYKGIFKHQQQNPEKVLLEVYKTIFKDESLTRACVMLS